MPGFIRDTRLSVVGILLACVGLFTGLGVLVVHFWPAMAPAVQQAQNNLHRDLAAAIQAIQSGGGAAFWSLIASSFGYGVFHAAGPGHGKMVISMYVASHRSRLMRGIALSFASSLVQGIMAIGLVFMGTRLLQWTARETNAVAGEMEILSYGLIACLGLYLVIGALRRLVRRYRDREFVKKCSHACSHGLAPSDSTEEGLFQILAIIASVGVRPCSGALLVLIFAATLDIFGAGALAVLAMSFGTALTVATLAVVARSARSVAERFGAWLPGESGFWRWASDVVALAGGLTIMALGITLVEGALAVQSHPLL